MDYPLDLNEIIQRPARYWLDDGLVELFLGATMLIPACLFGLCSYLPKGSPVAMVAPLGWLLTMLLVKRGFLQLKSRLVAPRTGYIAPPEPGKAMRIAGPVLVAALVIAVGIALSFLPRLAWRGSFFGFVLALVFAFTYLLAWRQTRLPRLLVLAAVPLLAAAVIWVRQLNGSGALLFLLFTQGGAVAVSGLLRLRLFLKSHPRTDAAE